MIELRIKGMGCRHCVDTITEAIRSLDADANVLVEFESIRVCVDGRSSVNQLTKALKDAGFLRTYAGIPDLAAVAALYQQRAQTAEAPPSDANVQPACTCPDQPARC